MKLAKNLSQVTLKMNKKGSTGRMGLGWLTGCMKHFGLKEMMEEECGHARKSNREIQGYEKMMSVVMMRVAGGDRVEDVENLRVDRELVNSLGWNRMAGADTCLNYMSNQKNNQRNIKVNEKLIIKAIRKSTIQEFTYDNDATYIDSDKKSASYSYNKVKQFSGLLGCIAELKLINTVEYRTGRISPAFGIYDQLRKANEQVKRAGKRMKRFRSDSAAHQNNIFKYCDKESIAYYITLDKNARMMKVVDGIECWEVLRNKKDKVTDKKWAISEYETPEGLKIRILILRWRNPSPDLFDASPYCYHVIGTNNKRIEPMAWLKLHSGRMGTIEYYHKELKRELGCAYNPSHNFEKNRGYFLLGVMAYNMVQIMKLYYFEKEYETMSIKRFRYQFINVCGRIVKTGRTFYCHIINTTNQIYEMYRSCKSKLIIHGY